MYHATSQIQTDGQLPVTYLTQDSPRITSSTKSSGKAVSTNQFTKQSFLLH